MSAGGKYDDFVSALQAVGDSLEDMDAAVFIAVRTALKEWAEETAVDAIDLLSRPNWLLSQYIGSKVVEYLEDRKVQAMAGFRYRETSNRFAAESTRKASGGKKPYIPDPGYYGRYFEGGMRKKGRPYSTRAHFLRDAKRKNINTLKELVNNAFDEAKKELLQGRLDEIKSARKARRRAGDYSEPREGYLN